MEKLRKYIASRGLTQAQFAELVGCTPAMICRLLNGSKRPSLQLAIRIEEATRGRVPPRAWKIEEDPKMSPEKIRVLDAQEAASAAQARFDDAVKRRDRRAQHRHGMALTDAKTELMAAENAYRRSLSK